MRSWSECRGAILTKGCAVERPGRHDSRNPGRLQGLGASRNETEALRLSPWNDPTTSTGPKSRSPLKP